MIFHFNNVFMENVPIVLRINDHFSNHLSHHQIFMSDFFSKVSSLCLDQTIVFWYTLGTILFPMVFTINVSKGNHIL